MNTIIIIGLIVFAIWQLKFLEKIKRTESLRSLFEPKVIYIQPDWDKILNLESEKRGIFRNNEFFERIKESKYQTPDFFTKSIAISLLDINSYGLLTSVSHNPAQFKYLTGGLSRTLLYKKLGSFDGLSEALGGVKLPILAVLITRSGIEVIVSHAEGEERKDIGSGKWKVLIIYPHSRMGTFDFFKNYTVWKNDHEKNPINEDSLIEKYKVFLGEIDDYFENDYCSISEVDITVD